MRVLLLLVVMFSLSLGFSLKYNSDSVDKWYKEFKSLDSEQVLLLKTIYQECRPFDLQNTCAAIAMKESYMGKYVINPDTGDYGIMQISAKTYFKRHKIRSRWKKIEFISRLLRDDRFCIAKAIEVLTFWRKRLNNYKYVWNAYNRGYGYKKDGSYANDIYNIILAFRKYKKNVLDRIDPFFLDSK